MSIDNVRTLHLSILGVGLQRAQALQNRLTSFLSSHERIEWVTIAHPKLDALFVDQLFSDAISVQKIVQQGSTPAFAVDQHSIYGLSHNGVKHYIPFENNSQLREWFRQEILQYQALVSLSSQHSNAPFGDALLGNQLSNQPFNHPQPSIQPKTQQTQAMPNLLPSTEIFATLRQRKAGLVQIFCAKGLVGVADPAKELFWPVARATDSLPAQLALLPAVANNIPPQAQPIDLKQWMWQKIWQTPQCATWVDSKQSLRFDFYPQPSPQDRRDVLRMAAYLQKFGGSALQVAQHTQLPLSRVQHFISSLVGAGFAQYASPAPSPAPVASSTAQSAGGWQGLFNKLRQKLGL